MSPTRDRSPRFEYQSQESTLTLAAGLDEYSRGHPALIRPEAMGAEDAELFRHHDICHVIFGLDTTMVDEAMADLRTVLGTDVGVRCYVRYLRTSQEAQRIFEAAGYLRVIGATLRATPRFVRALFQALRTRRRWPWNPPEEYLGKPLRLLRAAHGIRVI